MKQLILLLVCLSLAITSQGAVLTVDDDGPADFENIPDALNASMHGDTIVVKSGTYSRRITFNNMAVTLTSEDPDDPNVVQATVITTDSGYSVSFDVDEDSGSVLTGFTITGQGIHCYGTSPTITKNMIRDCGGYGIYGENNAAPITSYNQITASRWQGIYSCHGPITNNVISENNGGIAYCDGPITNNIISYNSNVDSGRGGALSFCDGPITGNVIEGNYASYKGGGFYECTGDIIANIITANQSAIAGGGVCNCRGKIMNNIIAGNTSDTGGGLFSCTQVLNNTIVGNTATINGGALGQCPGEVKNNIIAFNKAAGLVGGIYGASVNSHNVFWSNDGGNVGAGAGFGDGDVIADPLFAKDGYWDDNETPDDDSDDVWVDGDYHVQSKAGRWSTDDNEWVLDVQTSPCIDAGDTDSDWTAELWPHGRRINIGAYGGTAQAGMSFSTVGTPADLNPVIDDVNDWVDLRDMALLSDKWLSREAPLIQDINRDGLVDFADFAILADNWLPEPPTPQPPTPNPMAWKTEPHATSTSTITMVAAEATSTDGSGVEYYFECITGGGHDSDWQEEQTYTDEGLAANTTYSYRVKARNKANQIETSYSERSSATTFPEDTTAPLPNPATWKTEPYVVPPASIRMIATTASDDNGVEYYFECTSHPAYSSDWQDSPEYQTPTLPKDSYYSFVTRTRDKSPNQNMTQDSTEVTLDLEAPTPNPMEWESEPEEVNHGGGTFDYWAEMTAVEATDSSGDVEYYFQCTTESGFSSGWQTSRTYEVKVGRSGQRHRFRVKTRDIYGNETAYSTLLPAL
ncbi:MAG: right-handed parallel beta-helix repeat-containing protein [Sedimentisphaerales bacterium]|nr:right-handed parallel beta-helix repeat-containing protein [Sedimentisphaerales bacterium]